VRVTRERAQIERGGRHERLNNPGGKEKTGLAIEGFRPTNRKRGTPPKKNGKRGRGEKRARSSVVSKCALCTSPVP